MKQRLQALLLALLLTASLALAGCAGLFQPEVDLGSVSISDFQGDNPWVVLDGNQPAFTDQEKGDTQSFEDYTPLDALGRCGVAYANLSPELMPTQERGEIGQVKPAGWHTVRYDWVDGEYLYNRCHLIGFQLAGENANQRNLITGTRYLNTQGMLPFENQVADYIESTGNHVLYRVTPVYEGADLVPWGVEMEAWSVEDNGAGDNAVKYTGECGRVHVDLRETPEGIVWSVEDNGAGVCFHVLCFNAQPGVTIDYATGDSWAEGENTSSDGEITYILNTSSLRFHNPDCAGAARIAPANRQETTANRELLLAQGYQPCGTCKP